MTVNSRIKVASYTFQHVVLLICAVLMPLSLTFAQDAVRDVLCRKRDRRNQESLLMEKYR